MRRNRLNLLIILIGMIGCCTVGFTGKDNIHESAHYNTPDGFESFDEPRVYAYYDDSINGYDVKVMILPSYRTWRMSCRAIISFSKGGSNFKIIHDGWLDTLCYDFADKSVVMPRDTVIRLSYDMPKVSKDEEFRMETFSKIPFFFYDIDFDGNDELLLNYVAQGQRLANVYEPIEVGVQTDRLYSPYNQEPFTELDDLTIIDPTDKSISIVYYEGHGEEWHTVYKYVPLDEYGSYGMSEQYTDIICYWGVFPDTIPQYRRINAQTNDTTQWMPLDKRVR